MTLKDKDDDKEDVERLRDDGMARAVAHADAVREAWSPTALAWLDAYVQEVKRGKHPFANVQGFTSYHVRQFAEARGFPPPPDSRAWGAVFVKAIKAKLIEFANYAPHPDPKRHRAPAAHYYARRGA